ncbi:MAG: PspC domain-containing protein [Arcicella sp.]|nr:PspC domain-containing protein [Arcicella sp.]
MKKTISINIAGTLFYIEEDGFEKLNTYLKAIQKYFSSYEGSKEIVEDIEARIAEKFWKKRKADEKQTISLEDVEGLITSMGSVADFEAIQEEEDLVMAGEKTEASQANESDSKKKDTHGFEHKTQYEKSSSEYKYDSGVKKLYRDTRRKLLGGVCAGLAHNLGLDPLLVRLIFLFLFLVFGPITGGTFTGIMAILYLACWIAFTANPALEEDDRIRKFYRNPDEKVLGGVMSGIASFTGWDLGILRFVSVLSIFLFGSGIIIYLILWVIAPEAKTLTDKMQMSGEPITLENIESNIRKTSNVEDKTENTLSSLLLLPFRVISRVFKALGPFAEFLISAGRIFVGGIMTFTGIVTILALFFGLFVGVSALDDGHILFFNLPVGLMGRDASPLMIFGGFLASVVPAFVIGWAGISLIIRKNLFTPTVWQSALGVFLIGLFVSMYTGVRYARNFAKTSSVEKITNYLIDPKIPVFDVKGNSSEHNQYARTEIEGYEGSNIKLEQTFSADGKTKQDAEQNALMTNYSVVQKDSIIVFDEEFELKENAIYRDQRLRNKIFIPYDKPFSMTREFASFITNTLDRQYWDEQNGDKFKGSLWKFTKDGELICINRTITEVTEDEDGNRMQTLDIKDFENIKITNDCNIIIEEGDKFEVKIQEGDKLQYEVKNNTLEIKNDVTRIYITMPKLKGIMMKNGSGECVVKDFKMDDLDIELLSENSLTVSGSAKSIKAKLSNSASLKAFDLESDKVEIEVKDESYAEVNANNNLIAKSNNTGKIIYRGTPTSISKTVTDTGSIEKEQ